MSKCRAFIVAVAVSVICLGSFAQNSPVSVKCSSFEKIELSLETGHLNVYEIQSGNGIFSQIAVEGFLLSTEVGKPRLPVLVETLEIPLCESVEVKVISQKWSTFSATELGLNHRLFPAQPEYPKSSGDEHEFVINDEVYLSDTFYARELASVEKIGVARNKNVANLFFSPVAYNPVTGEIRVCTSAEVSLTFVNADENGTRRMKRLHCSPMFCGMPTVNALPESGEKSEYSSAPVRMLIVAHHSFRGQLDSLVNWKKRKGFITDIVYTNDPGVGLTTQGIASYLESQYVNATPENPAPTFVLLVGDVEQVPAFNSRIGSYDHVTDLYYFTWTSDDNLPDCHYGRFSAQTIDQLVSQVEKTLMYENYGMRTPFYLDKAVLVSGIDGGRIGDNAYQYADPAMRYIEDNYVNASNHYATVNSYYNEDGTNSTSDVSGNIMLKLSAGFSIANYSAHCSPEGWSNPAIRVSMLSSMNNAQRFGIMIGNCCESNRFNEYECFGEAVLRLDNYRGAVGYIGASNVTYWVPDFYWSVGAKSGTYYNYHTGVVIPPAYSASRLGMYDCLFHLNNEAFPKWYTTSGGMIFSGNSAVQNSTERTDRKTYYWEVYHLMGDPSVIPWLHSASNMTVTANTSLETGATSLAVTAVPYAYIALTDSNLNLVAATVANSSGNATLRFSALERGDYELAATAQNYKINFTGISVRNPEEYDGMILAGNFSVRTFPNPASNALFVEAPDISEVSLTDMLGNQRLSTGMTDGNRVEISLEKCPAGLYVVGVTNQKGEKAYRKIVVKK